jgi:hypothetical protein
VTLEGCGPRCQVVFRSRPAICSEFDRPDVEAPVFNVIICIRCTVCVQICVIGYRSSTTGQLRCVRTTVGIIQISGDGDRKQLNPVAKLRCMNAREVFKVLVLYHH